MTIIQNIPEEKITVWTLYFHSAVNWRVRKALREICEHFSQGFRSLKHPTLRQSIKGLYPHADLEVDRWVLKALVEIGSREDKGFFLNAWRSSNDEENCLWAFAGLIKVSTLDEFEKLKKKSQFPVSDHVLLAACIAGKPNFVQGLSPVKIDNAGRIVLLWACLCFAIDRKRENIFDPKFDQIIQFGRVESSRRFRSKSILNILYG